MRLERATNVKGDRRVFAAGRRERPERELVLERSKYTRSEITITDAAPFPKLTPND